MKGVGCQGKEFWTVDNRIFKPGNGMIIQASVEDELKGG